MYKFSRPVDLQEGSRIYFMGIGGTGMAAVAGLCKEKGFDVRGSDKAIYPPTSDLLAKLGIPVLSPYAPTNIQTADADLVVIANALSRGHPELEEALRLEVPYASFPQLLRELFLKKQKSLVISGTHGKTTTTSLLAFLLDRLGLDPSFLIGGLPHDLPESFRLGGGPYFAIEGDEYDTAFFDKGPKFLHYEPQFLIINNIEFDHADIYKNVEAIKEQFAKLCSLVPAPERIVANVDDPHVCSMLRSASLYEKVTGVSPGGKNKEGASLIVERIRIPQNTEKSIRFWEADIRTLDGQEISLRTQLSGDHNIANIAHILGLFWIMGRVEKNLNFKDSGLRRVAALVEGFRGVRRRLELLGEVRGVKVFEDFAHHPTAIRTVIEGFRRSYPGVPLTVAFEPANATNRRNVFVKELSESLMLADRVFIGPSPVDLRIPEHERMDTQFLEKNIGRKAVAFGANKDLLTQAARTLRAGEAIIFMSSSSFSGVQYELLKALAEPR